MKAGSSSKMCRNISVALKLLTLAEKKERKKIES